jgi:Flp pilus assembly protein TadB
VSTQDVTATVIDLAARIQSQQASVDRVRALLARAQSIADITSIESELARRESDLESLKAQQRNLDDLTALSTIAVTLLGPDAATPAAPKPAQTGFLAGLKAGWKAFAASVGVLLTVLGAVLPFAVLIGVPLWLALVWRRRRNRALQLRATEPLSVPASSAPRSAPEPASSATVAPKTGSAG